MDDKQFDGLIRALSNGTSRRGALGLLAAAAELGLREVTATAKHHKGKGKGKANGNRSGNAKRRHHHQPTAKGQKCQAQGKPCEGTQSCCEKLVCAGGGQGLSMRCTPCPTGTVVWQGTCCRQATTCL